MKFSIVTPAYNAETFIEKCLTSIRDQTYSDFEYIVVNDGSVDGTEQIVKKFANTFELKLISQPNSGIASAMNAGFDSASGDILAWLDADNYYTLDALKTAAREFINDPSLDILYGDIEFDFSNGRKKGYSPPHDISFKKALIDTTGAIPLQPAVFFKRHLYSETGGFNSAYRVAGDYDFWLKALERIPKLKYLPYTFGIYTIISSGASQSSRGIINSFKEVYNIASQHKQPAIGKIKMCFKFGKGFIANIIRQILKHA